MPSDRMHAVPELAPRTRLVLGLGMLAAALPPVLIAIGVIVPRPGTVHAPKWIVLLAGCLFVFGGVLILLPARMRLLRGFLGGLLVTALGVVFDWIAFGLGDRRFSGGMSIGPLFNSTGSDEAGGRIAFGIAGVLITLFALWAWGKWLRSLLASGADEANRDRQG